MLKCVCKNDAPIKKVFNAKIESSMEYKVCKKQLKFKNIAI